MRFLSFLGRLIFAFLMFLGAIVIFSLLGPFGTLLGIIVGAAVGINILKGDVKSAKVTR